eukprot:647902-Amphidinium_carterae.1
MPPVDYGLLVFLTVHSGLQAALSSICKPCSDKNPSGFGLMKKWKVWSSLAEALRTHASQWCEVTSE